MLTPFLKSQAITVEVYSVFASVKSKIIDQKDTLLFLSLVSPILARFAYATLCYYAMPYAMPLLLAYLLNP